MRTTFNINQNEIRACELTLNDDDGVAFTPSAAFVTINDENDVEVVARQEAYVSSNKIYTVIGTTTSGTIGKYKALWEIHKSGYTYYHTTIVNVMDL